VVEVETERDEADMVTGLVAQLRFDGENLRDMAVFYRTNAQSRVFEEALMRAAIPYQILGGLRFYERKEVKDILAHLQLLVNPRDAVSLQRVVECRPTGVGAKTLARITAAAHAQRVPVFDLLQAPDFADRLGGRVSAKVRSFAEWCRELGTIPTAPVGPCIQAVIDHSGLPDLFHEKSSADPRSEARIENLNALVERAAIHESDHPDGNLAQFLEEVALIADVDNHDPDADALTLMTLHSAKGLEFHHVFLVGVEEGYLPHVNCSEDEDMIEEERRLFYVGLTRARTEAVLSFARYRYMWGGADYRTASRFIGELPKQEIERHRLRLNSAFRS